MDGGLILRSWWFGWTGVPNFQTSDGHMTSELYTMERFGGRSLGPVCMMSEHPCLGFSAAPMVVVSSLRHGVTDVSVDPCQLRQVFIENCCSAVPRL